MEKKLFVIEFGSRKLKLVLGTSLDGQVYTIYTVTKPYGHMISYGGEIESPDRLINIIREFIHFQDDSVQLRVNVSNAVLAIPPYQLSIFQNKQLTPISSDDRKIGSQDIHSLYNLIKNETSSIQGALVDIMPDMFILDSHRETAHIPLGESARMMEVRSRVFILPKKIVGDFENCLIESGVAIRRSMTATIGAVELLSSYEDIPETYILCDIGSDTTVVGLVGKKKLYATETFAWGGAQINERIMGNFNIGYEEAEKIKITYGIDYQEMNFRAPVSVTNGENGEVINHYNDELNIIIKKELDAFLKEYEYALNKLLTGYDTPQLYKQLPLILVGGGSRLKGLIEYIEHKVQNESVKSVVPRALGARNATFTNCLGLILAASKYPVVYDEARPKGIQLSRETNSKDNK